MSRETVNEALRAAPPVGVGGLTLWGMNLNEWVLILTCIYTLFLIIDKLFSIWEKYKHRRKHGKSN